MVNASQMFPPFNAEKIVSDRYTELAIRRTSGASSAPCNLVSSGDLSAVFLVFNVDASDQLRDPRVSRRPRDFVPP